MVCWGRCSSLGAHADAPAGITSARAVTARDEIERRWVKPDLDVSAILRPVAIGLLARSRLHTSSDATRGAPFLIYWHVAALVTVCVFLRNGRIDDAESTCEIF